MIPEDLFAGILNEGESCPKFGTTSSVKDLPTLPATPFEIISLLDCE